RSGHSQLEKERPPKGPPKCMVPDVITQPRPEAVFESAFRQEFEKNSAECCRITTRSIVVDILKNRPLSAQHTLADRFTDQREVWLRFLPPHDKRRPGEVVQHVARNRRGRRGCEQQRESPGLVEHHRPSPLRCMVEPTRRE